MEDVMAPWNDFDVSNLEGLQRGDSPRSADGRMRHRVREPGEAFSPRASSPARSWAGGRRDRSKRPRGRQRDYDSDEDDGREGEAAESQGDATVATKKRRKGEGAGGGDGEMNPLRVYVPRKDQVAFFQYLEQWRIRQNQQPNRHCALHWHEKLPGTISEAQEGAENAVHAALQYVNHFRWRTKDKLFVAHKTLEEYEKADAEFKLEHPFDLLDACHCAYDCGDREENLLYKFLDAFEGQLENTVEGGLYFRAVDTPPDHQPFMDRGASQQLKHISKSANDTIAMLRSRRTL